MREKEAAMPLVVVNFGQLPKSGDWIRELLAGLPVIVAEELTCADPGGELEPDHVGVITRQRGRLDVNESHLGIIVIANDFPSRRANQDSRRTEIVRRISELMSGSGVHGSVWVLLAPGSYGTF